MFLLEMCAKKTVVRGERARHNFEFLMKRWRAAVFIQKHVRLWLARTVFKNQQKDIIFLQSGNIFIHFKYIFFFAFGYLP